ncbi:DUF397 domain-containing protein [Paractinoplanes deccanensis]
MDRDKFPALWRHKLHSRRARGIHSCRTPKQSLNVDCGNRHGGVQMIYRTEELRWHRSRHCSGGTCVEVARAGDNILVRDSKDPRGAVLSFTPSEWRAFIEGVKRGELSFE